MQTEGMSLTYGFEDWRLLTRSRSMSHHSAL